LFGPAWQAAVLPAEALPSAAALAILGKR
jgi:hypothetical protein